MNAKLSPYSLLFYNEWKLNPERTDYNIVVDSTIYGNVDTSKFQNGMLNLINNNTIFRSNVVEKEGVVCWKLREPAENVVDYYPNNLSKDEIYDLVSQPFDLENDLLARHLLIKEDEQKYRIIFIYSHLLIDGVSSDEHYSKWSAYYNDEYVEEFSEEEEICKVQVLSEHFEKLIEENKEKMELFWKKHLRDLSGIDLTFLKSFNPKPVVERRYVDEVSFGFNTDILSKVKSLKTYRITPYLYGQMILAILFRKITNMQALGISYPVAIMEGKELVYGAHVNTCIVDYRFDKDTTLQSLIEELVLYFKEFKLSKGKYLPIDNFIKYANDTGILNIAFSQTFARDSFVRIKGLTDSKTNHEFQIDLVNELLIEQEEGNGILHYRVRYDKNILDENLVQNFITIYQKLFLEILEDLRNGKSDILIDSYSLLTEEEYHRQVYEWNNTRGDYPKKKTIPKLLEDQVKLIPDNIAAVCCDRTLTYRELNDEANKLANYLIQNHKIGPGDLVPICVDRNSYALIGIFAILKTGAGYVPIDKKIPDARIRFLIQDCKSRLLLTNRANDDRLETILSDMDPYILYIDDKNLFTAFPVDTPLTNTQPDNIAYIIYTSGTTGNPKGVMVEHRGVVNLCTSVDCIYNVYEGGRKIYKKILAYSNFIFDAHVLDIHLSLTNGHTIYLVNDELRYDMDDLSNYISDNKIDTAFMTPAVLSKDKLFDIKEILIGGESPSFDVMNSYRDAGVTVWQLYGPTEGTVINSYHQYEIGESYKNIGKPFKNQTLYVLDANMQITPVGVLGELYIGGVGVSKGYLNSPEPTSEKFVPNPFQTEEEKAANYNGILYKSGDIVRYMADGNIEFGERKGSQVKIRGFRIELGEIESALSNFSGVRQALVVVKEDANSKKLLVAYYVSANELDEDKLIQHLSKILPNYMIPSAFVCIEELPLTINGKINYKELPEPKSIYIGAENETERELCSIFTDLLNISNEKISMLDDFFHLGGDSIIGIQLVNKIRQKFNINLPVQCIYKYRNIKSISAELVRAASDKKEIQTEQGILMGEVDLLPIQQWFFDSVGKGLLPDFNHWNQSFILSVPKLNEVVLQESIKKLVEYHDAFRLLYKREQGVNSQIYQNTLPDINFDSLDISKVPNKEELYNILTCWQNNFDIYKGVLFHIGYLHGYDNDEARLHISIHHLIVDAVSWKIMANDLKMIYERLLSEFRNNQSIEIIDVKDILGAKGTSYRQWVASISKYKKIYGERESLYWDNIIHNIMDYNTLWVNNQKEKQCTVKITLGKEYIYKIQKKNLNNIFNTNLNDLLLTAFSLSLNEFTEGQLVHYVTLEGHGRESIENNVNINNTIGWFTSLYPVKLHVLEDKDIRKTIVQTKDMLRAIPHNGVGYGAIYGYVKNDLPVIAFNYLGQLGGSNTSADWNLVNKETGLAVSPNNKDRNVMSVNCGMIDEQLVLLITGQLTHEQFTDFTQIFNRKLETVINTLEEETRTYLTLSDINHIISEEYLMLVQKDKEISKVFLANSLQQGFIFHHINQGNSDEAYRIQILWDYTSPIKENLLKKAWAIAMDQYPILKARFAWDEELIQIIDKEGCLNWYDYDISDMKSENDKDSFYSEILDKDKYTGYNISQSSLFRIYLIKRNSNMYSCIFNFHHAILDGWSLPILLQYVHKTYLKLLKNEAVLVNPDDTYQLAQNFIQTRTNEHKDFWTNYIAKVDGSEDLTGLFKPDKKQVNLSNYRYVKEQAVKDIILEGEQYKKLKEACASNGITVNVLLQYCWHKCLNIYTNNKNTIVGMVTSGRNLPIENIENSIGLYINTLPVIVEHINVSLKTALQELQDNINTVNDKNYINLSELQSSEYRLFSSLFAFENYPTPRSFEEENLSFRFTKSVEKFDYPIVIAVLDNSTKMTLKLNYSKELFEIQSIKNLLGVFSKIIDQFIANNDIYTADLNLLHENEQIKISKWNSTYKELPYLSETIQKRFELQVERIPQETALVYNNISLTYYQLNEKANKLAHYLIKNFQIKPDDTVLIVQNRSENAIISILAVLKAGGAYVPIDTNTPSSRLQYILKDTQSKIVLTNTILQDQLDEIGASYILVDNKTFLEEVNTYSSNNPQTNTTNDNLCYIIYTSGTTGQPKGVMIEHKGIINLSYGLKGIYAPREQNQPWHKKCLGFSNFSFDAHALDLYPAILNGHTLYLIDDEMRFDMNQLSTYIHKNKIEVGLVTPALLDNDIILKMDTLLVGGESTNADTIKNYLNNGIDIINLYGPTEISICSSSHKFTLDDGYNNIGRTIDNITYYILNDDMQQLPIGVTGELYIGGTGVSRGYLNNPELTSQKFVKNPFQTEEDKKHNFNSRLYKTGDCAKYHPNGEVEYVGRNDSQIKMRGFRIEPGEIESILKEVSGIKQVVVTLKEVSKGLKYLVAYYVSEEEISVEILKRYLDAKLPEYMVPLYYIHMHKLPTTINGKTDYKALPAPNIYSTAKYTPPATNLEKKLCGIFADILNLDSPKLSIEDDFFALGGSSILAIKLMTRINRELNSKISFTSILENRNVQRLSYYLSRNIQDDNIRIEKIDISEIKGESLLSFSQERMLFLETYEGGSNVYNIPMIFEIKEDTSEPALLSAIQKIIDRHEILHSKIKTSDDGFGYQKIENSPLKIDKQVLSSVSDMERAISETINRVFIIWEEYPIHVKIYQLEQKKYMSIVIHHIAFDGWSADIFLNELVELYHFYNNKLNDKVTDHSLPDLTIQYQDYAVWLRRNFSGNTLQQQLKYWKENLAGYSLLNLQTDNKRPVYFDYKGDNIFFTISEQLSAELRDLAKNKNVSLFHIMLSGYYLLLSAFSGQKDIVIGTPVSGRHYEGVQHLIGCFVNTLVLRYNIDSSLTFSEYYRKVEECVSQALANQDLPFEQLVNELKVEKDTSRNPIFQVMFGLQSFGANQMSKVKEILNFYENDSVKQKSSQFDMVMMMDDSENSIKGMVNYSTSLFNNQTIHTYIDLYINILKQMICLSNNDINTLSAINYIEDLPQEKMISGWNSTYKEISDQPQTIHEGFELQVEKTPHNIALKYKDITLTYHQLNEKANRLADYLIVNKHIEVGDLVVLFLDRSEHIIISILAIIKAGGAYVPLDPDIPQSRLQYILQDTQCKTVLTNSKLKYKIDELNLSSLSLDDSSFIEEIESCSANNPKRTITKNDLCYVIYTSGTTGQPKGVMIEHRGVLNLVNNIYDINKEDITGNNVNYYNCNFDAHAIEIYPVILNGGTLFVLADEIRLNIDKLYQFMIDNKIKKATIPPALLSDEYILKVNTLVVGGEVTNQNVINVYLENDINIVNSYGPTEVTVASSNHNFKLGDSPNNIGRAMMNVTYYILNEDMQQLPIGAIGELYIGGEGVSRGYFNNKQLTSEKFLTNPFQSKEDKKLGFNAKIYKTGDLAKYLFNGEVEYIGRNDFQIKIRGFRIELEEIENTIIGFNGIKQAVVRVKVVSEKIQYLIAYYVSEKNISSESFVEFLNSKLPDYMIPSHYVQMQNLPTTNNGKLDYKSLPDPQIIDIQNYVPPVTDLERKLCDIFGEILDIDSEEISIEDNFFTLGGSSILAIRLMGKINLATRANVNLMETFDNNTVRLLAKFIENKNHYTPITIFNNDVKENLFMLHPSMGDSDIYRLLANKLKAKFNCYGINSYNRHNVEKISDLSLLANRYISEIDKIQQNNKDYYLLGWSLGGQFALEIAAQLEIRGVQNITVYLLDTWLLYKGLGTTSREKNTKMSEMMDIFNIPNEERVEVKKVLILDEQLAMQTISKKLEYTRVILFRAIDDSNTEKYRQEYSLNNIDSCINSNAIKVIDINSDHNNMLKQEKVIYQEIVHSI